MSRGNTILIIVIISEKGKIKIQKFSLNYQTHQQEIYTSRLFNYSKLSKSKNKENFERELEELTESMSLGARISHGMCTGFQNVAKVTGDDIKMTVLPNECVTI
ncbi:hypothetical protein Glove_97g10 [Diversispora epigaea]|uniref:Uncharacterized protein n=1 Tax=Diversispora epigaea TaxID=1348612 RepID=A0A397JBG7_9GLOM|nr:hypothetical protein Glove_97g10 [Diversispora epigaea]